MLLFIDIIPQKHKVLKDWHLVGATLLVTGIALVLLLLEAAVPQLRGTVTRERDGERAQTRTVSITIIYYAQGA